MNNFLTHKNEECIKHNSADFYTMSIYSKDIMNLDKLRLNEFSNFSQICENKNNNLKWFGEVKSNKFKILSAFVISSALIYRFKSVLVVPIFYTGYYIIKGIIFNRYEFRNCGNECYFCQKNSNVREMLEKYEKYYSVINYIIDKNPNISSLEEFERDLDICIKENNT